MIATMAEKSHTYFFFLILAAAIAVRHSLAFVPAPDTTLSRSNIASNNKLVSSSLCMATWSNGKLKDAHAYIMWYEYLMKRIFN